MAQTFINAQTRKGFETELSAGRVEQTDVAWIVGTKELWTHGVYYTGSPDWNSANVEFASISHKIIPREYSSGSNILAQAAFDLANCVYHIRYDFNLNGATINIPADCILSFEGGKFLNGGFNFNRTLLVGDIRMEVTVEGTYRAGQQLYDDINQVKVFDGTNWRNTDGTVVGRVVIL